MSTDRKLKVGDKCRFVYKGYSGLKLKDSGRPLHKTSVRIIKQEFPDEYFVAFEEDLFDGTQKEAWKGWKQIAEETGESEGAILLAHFNFLEPLNGIEEVYEKAIKSRR